MPATSHSGISGPDRGQSERRAVVALPPRPSLAPRAAVPSAAATASRAASPEQRGRRDASSSRPSREEIADSRPPSRSSSSIMHGSSQKGGSSQRRHGSAGWERPGSTNGTKRSQEQTIPTPNNPRPFSSSTYSRGDADRGGNRSSASRLKRSQGLTSKARPADMGFFYHSQDESEFYVCGKGLNDEQAAIMAPAISNARIVNLADNLLGAIPQLLPKGLEALDVSKNAIASLPLLSAPTLRELYLGGNGLERMFGLASALSIEVLDLSFNKLEIVEGLETLSSLKKLNLKANSIADQFDVRTLSFNRKLTLLDLSENPVVETRGFKHFILSILPELERCEAGVGQEGLFALRNRGVQYQKIYVKTAAPPAPEFPELAGPGLLWSGLPGYWDGNNFHRSPLIASDNLQGNANASPSLTSNKLLTNGAPGNIRTSLSPPPLPSPPKVVSSSGRSPPVAERGALEKEKYTRMPSRSVSPTKDRPPRLTSKKPATTAPGPAARPAWNCFFKPASVPGRKDESEKSRKLKEQRLTIYATDEPGSSGAVEFNGDRSKALIDFPPALPAEESGTEASKEAEEGSINNHDEDDSSDIAESPTESSLLSYSDIYLRTVGRRQEPTRLQPFYPRLVTAASISSPGGITTRIVSRPSQSSPVERRPSSDTPSTPDSISYPPPPPPPSMPTPATSNILPNSSKSYSKKSQVASPSDGNNQASQHERLVQRVGEDCADENESPNDARATRHPAPSSKQDKAWDTLPLSPQLRAMTGDAEADALELRSTLMQLLEHKRSIVRRLKSPSAA